MPLTYPGGPSVSLTAIGPAQRISGQSPALTLGLLGNSPIGNDHTTVCSIQEALTYFGNPSAAASAPYSIPRALALISNVLNLSGAQPFNVAIMAAGKVSSTVTFGTGNVLTATGIYAGTRGQNLSMTITVTASLITAITITDVVTSQVVQQFLASPNGPYNLTTPAQIANAINGANALGNPNSVVRMTSVGTILPTTTVSGAAFSTSSLSNGGGLTSSDASIDTLLAESLAYDIDFIVPLLDVKAIQPKIATHAAACASELYYRKFCMAPDMSATYAAVTSSVSAYLPALSDRYNAWGVPPINVVDPAVGGQNAVDPYYFAAIMGAMKAAFPHQATLDELPVPGVLGFAGWPDQGPYLTRANLIALGSAGFATAYTRQRSVGVYVADNITAGPYSLDGQNINPFYQFSIRDQDDLVSKTAVRIAKGFRGQPAPGTQTMATTIAGAIDEALSQLGILVSHSTTCVPLSGNPFNYSVFVNYIPQWPVLGINITTSFSFS